MVVGHVAATRARTHTLLEKGHARPAKGEHRNLENGAILAIILMHQLDRLEYCLLAPESEISYEPTLKLHAGFHFGAAAHRGATRGRKDMTELELKLSFPDRIANQAKAAGLLTSEAIEGLVREAIRKAAAQHLIEYGKRLREPGGPEIAESELESELMAVRAELREARAHRS
jgi:hypothetical protein